MNAMQIIQGNIAGKIARALDADNAGLAKKWRKIDAAATMLATACETYAIDPFDVVPNAIYAAQKVVKAVYAAQAGINTVDKYTRTVLYNAFENFEGKITNKHQYQSLSKFADSDVELALRLPKAGSTASTQASSSRKALQALGLASYDANDRCISANLESPLFQKLARIATLPESAYRE